jgi:L-lysine exporter family protein LysE/ArgO
MLDIFLTGAALSAGLILAIGAQNAFILSLGLKRQHAMKAALVCALADALLITVGVAGLGSLIAANALATTIAALGGGLFLVGYGVLAFTRALRPQRLEAHKLVPARWSAVLAQTLAVTFLNPHVYLDTVVLLGSVSAQYAASERPGFAAGAMSVSLVWFICLAGGASLLAPFLARPLTWRVIDALTGTMMLFLGWMLLAPYWATPSLGTH